MSDIELIRKANGKLFRNSDNRVVVVKNGVNFSLNNDEMEQLRSVLEGVLDGSLQQIDMEGRKVIKGD